ncbi:bifunctional riboflavin kinase/FAD synthetase [Haloimpatiens sp. FM7330]|uniref:bifunctional riboflavin kinase/FAD synthetase n=1 Tax=Haloimpatiens sp. FM7330 TaxID=3298610 RepID=UPI00363EC506
MVIIEDNFKMNLSSDTYVSLGSFDGLHLGHMQLIKKAIQCSKDNNTKSMIHTFKNHPLSIINKELAPKLIMSNKTKVTLLNKMGIDMVNLVPFNKEYMSISPEKFIELLIKHYNAKGIIVGFNFRFGRKNSGDVELLKKLSKKLGFDLHIISPVKFEDEIVCSTRIRKLIKEGNVEKANSMLYQCFSLEGEVIKGKHFGRKMNFPTANIKINSDMIVPKNGVYYTVVKYDEKIFKGITNIGYSPTVDGKNLTIETNILDFNKDIYGENIEVYFVKRMRNEVKFQSVQQLINQLSKDKMYANNQPIIPIY